MGLLVPVLVALLAVATYFIGILDRPAFVYQDSILPSSENILAIVAVSTNQNVGDNVLSLKRTTESAIMSSPDGASMLEAAARSYGGGALGKLGVGLFFDDPNTNEHPRWAMGWAVQTNPKQARLIAAQGSATMGLSSPLRVVRIPNSRVLKASIPWRSSWTPWIAPMLHWQRGFAEYTKDNSKDGAMSLELYVYGNNGKYKTIDYLVYPDAAIPLKDAFGAAPEAELVDIAENFPSPVEELQEIEQAQRIQEEVVHQVPAMVEETSPEEEVPAQAEPEPDTEAKYAAEPEHQHDEQAQYMEETPAEAEEEHFDVDAEEENYDAGEVGENFEPEHEDEEQYHEEPQYEEEEVVEYDYEEFHEEPEGEHHEEEEEEWSHDEVEAEHEEEVDE